MKRKKVLFLKGLKYVGKKHPYFDKGDWYNIKLNFAYDGSIIAEHRKGVEKYHLKSKHFEPYISMQNFMGNWETDDDVKAEFI